MDHTLFALIVGLSAFVFVGTGYLVAVAFLDWMACLVGWSLRRGLCKEELTEEAHRELVRKMSDLGWRRP